MKVSIVMTILLGLAAIRFANAQAAGDDLKQSVTGSFVYGVPVGVFGQNSVPGYSISYSYKPLHWLALEAGLDQVVHPVGTEEFLNNGIPEYVYAKDNLFFVPFGVRFLWFPGNGATQRWRITAGGGGVFLEHHFNNVFYESNSGFGGQAVASAEYALTPSGRFRLGVTARFYYVYPSPNSLIDRFFNIGPSFSYSFH